MIGDYIVVAVVYAIGLSFLGIIHYFWLRDAFKEKASSLDGRVENKGECEINPALNESSSMAGCQPSRFLLQTSSRRQRNTHKPFDPGAMTLVGRKPGPQKKMLRREKVSALSQPRVSGRS